MSGLNPPQFDAVNTLSGPMLVLAGAGTGKTRVITFRIARLTKKGVPPERILGVTFTNKAANEMQARLRELLPRPKKKAVKGDPKQKPKQPQISTFHSLCVRILRRHIEVLGYPARFAIYNRGDQEALARSVLREINIPDNVMAPSQLLYWIGSWKSKSITPNQAMLQSDSDQTHVAAIGFDRYQKSLKNAGCVDFDDLLLLTEHLFHEHESIRNTEAARFDHLLIDEYQDTNNSQYRIVKSLADKHRNICVVGDDDQSIYGWRGAEVEHILTFQKDWPDAKVIRLEENYRSTGAIIDVANDLIKFNKQRHDKILRSARPGGFHQPFCNSRTNSRKQLRRCTRFDDDFRNQVANPGILRSCFEPTNNRDCLKRNFANLGCRTSLSAACLSSTEKKSKTCCPTCEWSMGRPTKSPFFAYSTLHRVELAKSLWNRS